MFYSYTFVSRFYQHFTTIFWIKNDTVKKRDDFDYHLKPFWQRNNIDFLDGLEENGYPFYFGHLRWNSIDVLEILFHSEKINFEYFLCLEVKIKTREKLMKKRHYNHRW